jgi:pantoate kinase
VGDGPAVRQCYVSVGSPVPGGAGYTTSAVALGDVELRGRVLGDALRALAGWRQRYAHLDELAHVFAVVDEMEAQAVA